MDEPATVGTANNKITPSHRSHWSDNLMPDLISTINRSSYIAGKRFLFAIIKVQDLRLISV
jgi:hypothetical protein